MKRDLAEIPDNVKKGLTIIPVKHADEVLKLALVSPLKPIEWIDPAEVEKVAGATTEERGVVTH